MKVGIVGPPDVVAGRVDQLELERVGWRVPLDRERELVIRRQRHAEGTMDYGVPAVSVEIEVHAHCLAVSTVRVRMNGDLDTLRRRRRPLRHGIKGVQYYSRDACLRRRRSHRIGRYNCGNWSRLGRIRWRSCRRWRLRLRAQRNDAAKNQDRAPNDHQLFLLLRIWSVASMKGPSSQLQSSPLPASVLKIHPQRANLESDAFIP